MATTTYLLPCSCGRMIEVEPRRAGEMLQCECGASRPAPTLREIQGLTPKPIDEPAPIAQVWGVGERLFLVGAVVALISLAAFYVLYRSWPVMPTNGMSPEVIQSFIVRLSPAESIQFFRRQLATGLDATKLPIEKEYDKKLARARGWLGVVSVLAAAGVLLMIAGARTRRPPDAG